MNRYVDSVMLSTIISWGVKYHDESNAVIVGTVSSPDLRNAKKARQQAAPTALYILSWLYGSLLRDVFVAFKHMGW